MPLYQVSSQSLKLLINCFDAAAKSFHTSKHLFSLHFLQFVLVTTSTMQLSPPRMHLSYFLCSPTARRKKALHIMPQLSLFECQCPSPAGVASHRPVVVDIRGRGPAHPAGHRQRSRSPLGGPGLQRLHDRCDVCHATHSTVTVTL